MKFEQHKIHDNNKDEIVARVGTIGSDQFLSMLSCANIATIS